MGNGMTIEIKYNIGDEVWITNCFNEPFKMEVLEIYIEMTKICEIYKYKLANGAATVFRNQNEMFPIKEELLKTLQYGE